MKAFVFGLFFGIAFCKLAIDRNFINEVAQKVEWTTTSYEENVFKMWTDEDIKRMLGLHKQPKPFKIHLRPTSSADNLPENFDCYKNWPLCASPARNQGNCGSCWAFAATSVLSDRFCVKTHRKELLSPQYVIECDKADMCCDGGMLHTSFKFLTEVGTVPDHCLPYDMKCERCRELDCIHYKCKPDTIFVSDNVEATKKQIYAEGPVEGAMDVYRDFLVYKSGVYYHKTGELLGGHAIEVIGWGIEDGLDYWLCKNSWGEYWGDNGYFKIKMGDCDIDSNMITCSV